MSDLSRGKINLVLEEPSTIIKKSVCVICGNKKDKFGSTKLTSTDVGRNVIIKTSEKLADGIAERIEDKADFTYHVKSCYSTYKKRGERKQNESECHEQVANETRESTEPRLKRSKTSLCSPQDLKEKPYVICIRLNLKVTAKDQELKLLIQLFNFYKPSTSPRMTSM